MQSNSTLVHKLSIKHSRKTKYIQASYLFVKNTDLLLETRTDLNLKRNIHCHRYTGTVLNKLTFVYIFVTKNTIFFNLELRLSTIDFQIYCWWKSNLRVRISPLQVHNIEMLAICTCTHVNNKPDLVGPGAFYLYIKVSLRNHGAALYL